MKTFFLVLSALLALPVLAQTARTAPAKAEPDVLKVRWGMTVDEVKAVYPNLTKGDAQPIPFELWESEHETAFKVTAMFLFTFENNKLCQIVIDPFSQLVRDFYRDKPDKKLFKYHLETLMTDNKQPLVNFYFEARSALFLRYGEPKVKKDGPTAMQYVWDTERTSIRLNWLDVNIPFKGMLEPQYIQPQLEYLNYNLWNEGVALVIKNDDEQMKQFFPKK